MQTPTLRERLPGVLGAVAVQAAMLALLLLSLEVVRHLPQEKETILTLPPLAQPQRRPVVIDARGKAATAPPLRPAAPPLPAYATPGFAEGRAPGAIALAPPPGLAPCKPESYGELNASQRKACPPAPPRPDDKTIALTPDKPVKNAPMWQAEVDRRNAPVALPGAAGGVLGILGALLSGKFGDKRNYSYAPPEVPPMDGAEMTRQYALHGSGCPETDDTTKKNCERDRAATSARLSFALDTPAPTHPHVSDSAFSQALAATQARQRSLYGRPVLASGANTGGGDGKNGASGGTGAAAGDSGTPPGNSGR